MPTHKLLDIVGPNLRTLSDMDLGHFVVGLADAVDAHDKWKSPGSIPPPLPQTDEMRQVGNRHIILTKGAEGHDRYQIAARDANRPMVEMLTTMFIQWAVTRSIRENDPDVIAALGLVPKIPVLKSSPPSTMTEPEKVKAKYGKNSGSAYLSCSKVPKSRIFQVAYCQGDPSLEESWTIAGPFDLCSSMEVPGLELGKLYYFKVRCFGAGNTSPWSAIVSLRII